MLGCSFGWREQAAAGASFVYAHWHFQVASFFSSKSGIHEAKKKIQGTQDHTVPWILSPLSACLLSTPLSLPVLHIVLHNVQGFQLRLVGGTGKVTSTYSTFPFVEVFTNDLNTDDNNTCLHIPPRTSVRFQ